MGWVLFIWKTSYSRESPVFTFIKTRERSTPGSSFSPPCSYLRESASANYAARLTWPGDWSETVLSNVKADLPQEFLGQNWRLSDIHLHLPRVDVIQLKETRHMLLLLQRSKWHTKYLRRSSYGQWSVHYCIYDFFGGFFYQFPIIFIHNIAS
jgi:hypothetical protein